LKNENSVQKDEIKQLKDHNTNMSAEGKILQNRMMGMQQDFNKYKSLKDKIDSLNKEIETKNVENDRLNLELQMIKKHMTSKDNY